LENGTKSYISDPKKANYRELPATQFPATLNRQRNTLKSAYHAQSKIEWEKFMEWRIPEEWTQFIEAHYANKGHTLKVRDWAPTFISA
jgi:hypothetical protein